MALTPVIGILNPVARTLAGDDVVVRIPNNIDYKGHKIRGNVYFHDGRVRVPLNMELYVDEIQIDYSVSVDELSEETPKWIDIFFDNAPHQGEYISFSEKMAVNLEKIAEKGKRDVGFYFKPGNDFFEVEDTDKKKNILTIRNGQDTRMVIERRSGSISLVMLGLGEEGTSTVVNGDVWLLATAAGVKQGSGVDMDSVPMTLHIEDAKGNDLVGGKEMPEKIVFDDRRNMVMVPRVVPETYLECDSCDIEGHREEFGRHARRYLEKNGIRIDGEGTCDGLTLFRLERMIKRLPQRVRGSIGTIQLYRDSVEASGFMLFSKTPPAAFVLPSGIMTMHDGITEALFYHEAAHALTIELQKKEMSLLSASKDSFEGKWREAAGDVYGRDIGGEWVGPIMWQTATRWEDGKSGPKNGCINAYGCNNFYEDVATFTEYVRRPGAFKPLIDRTDPRYDPRYKMKLDLLHTYGFITDEDYARIMKEVVE